jgi:phospholipid/cholesterol/gamma-HCH transport system substrate-binding protein
MTTAPADRGAGPPSTRPAAPTSRPQRARPSRAGAAVLGAGLVVLLVAGLVSAFAAFSGTFSSYVTVTAALPATANAVAVGNPVDYRDIQVGTVAAVDATGSGGVRVVMHLDPTDLHVIPRTVHAAALPLSIFGTQYIDLEATAASAAERAHLVANQFIPIRATSASSSLQTTVANFDDLLTALHPADLAAAFDALATALQGQGTRLGATLAASASYLGQLLPHLPTFESDLSLLGTVGDQLAALTPGLLQTIDQTDSVAAVITGDRSTLSSVLTNGVPLSTTANGFLQQVADPYQVVAADLTPLLDDVAAHPNELSQVLAGFAAAAQGFATAASTGPYLAFTGSITITNPNALVLAGLGLTSSAQYFEQALGASAFNPAPYTAADCPQYGSWTAPSCATNAQRRAPARAVADTTALTTGAIAVSRGLTGRTPASTATVGLILDPLVGSIVSAGGRQQ